MPITLPAPAKINVHLRVFPAGSDGFHPLRSWFRTIDLVDELDIEEIEPQSMERGRLKVTCADPRVPVDAENLVVKASLLLNQAKQANPQLHVTLQKRIPLGAGLGGGSSNGAAMLAAEQRMRISLRREPYSRELLLKIALALGADVPFFLWHQLDSITDATCTGRGQIVQPFLPGRRHVVLLILPDLQVSTAEVYRRFDELPVPPEDHEPDFVAWSHLPAGELLPLLRNDLEAATFSLHPELSHLRERAEALLGRPVRMTGSGGALFSLYDDRDEAATGLERLATLGVRRLLA